MTTQVLNTGAVSNNPQWLPITDTTGVEWLYDRRILVFTVDRLVGKENIDAFFNYVAEVTFSWPADKPYLVLFHNTTYNWSPYIRKRYEAVYRNIPADLSGRVAMVMPISRLNDLVEGFTVSTAQLTQERVQMSNFFMRDIAVEWLIGGLHQ